MRTFVLIAFLLILGAGAASAQSAPDPLDVPAFPGAHTEFMVDVSDGDLLGMAKDLCIAWGRAELEIGQALAESEFIPQGIRALLELFYVSPEGQEVFERSRELSEEWLANLQRMNFYLYKLDGASTKSVEDVANHYRRQLSAPGWHRIVRYAPFKGPVAAEVYVMEDGEALFGYCATSKGEGVTIGTFGIRRVPDMHAFRETTRLTLELLAKNSDVIMEALTEVLGGKIK